MWRNLSISSRTLRFHRTQFQNNTQCLMQLYNGKRLWNSKCGIHWHLSSSSRVFMHCLNWLPTSNTITLWESEITRLKQVIWRSCWVGPSVTNALCRYVLCVICLHVWQLWTIISFSTLRLYSQIGAAKCLFLQYAFQILFYHCTTL